MCSALQQTIPSLGTRSKGARDASDRVSCNQRQQNLSKILYQPRCSSRLCGSAIDGAAPESLSLPRISRLDMAPSPFVQGQSAAETAAMLTTSSRRSQPEQTCRDQGHGLTPRGRPHKVQQSSGPSFRCSALLCQATFNALVFRAATTITHGCFAAWQEHAI